SFLYSGGVFKTLGVPKKGPLTTHVMDINDLGDIAGVYYGRHNAILNFYTKAGAYKSIKATALGAASSGARGINNNGVVVGDYVDFSSTYHGFAYGPAKALGSLGSGAALSAVPVPEPSAWAMMLLGFGALGAAARSRRRRLTAA